MVNQAKDLILNPRGTMKKLKDEKVAMNDIILYLAVIAVPTFLGILIGYGVVGFGYGWGPYSFRVSLGAMAVPLAIIYYILSIVGIIVFGYIFNALAPTFKSKQNLMQAQKLVAYAATPWLIAGILYIFPLIGILVLLAALYGLYILYLGLPIFMETPKDQQIIYLIIGIIVFIVVMFVVYAISFSALLPVFY